MSDHFQTTNGVRQGGIISPIYFNLYMDGLSQDLNESRIGCGFNGQIMNHLLYADDSCIIASSPTSLQQMLDICSNYAALNTIIYNESKTKYMCFKPKCFKNLNVPGVSLNNVKIKLVNNIKYLGVELNDKLSDCDDILRHRKYLYAKGNMFVNKFKLFTNNVKVRLFSTFCNNTYAGHLWTNYKFASFKKTNVAFNDIYRLLFNIKRGDSISEIYVANDIDSFICLLRKAAFRFRVRLLNSNNALIAKMVNSVYFYCHSSFTICWKRDLFA